MSVEGASWAQAITQAYAAEAKPPLTRELVGRVHAVLAEALDGRAGEASGSDLMDRLNTVLDTFESDLRSVVGPRITVLDAGTGSVTMRHRSEAGQPLRAFGGQ